MHIFSFIDTQDTTDLVWRRKKALPPLSEMLDIKNQSVLLVSMVFLFLVLIIFMEIVFMFLRVWW
jgi:hypothetical protein